MRAGRLDRRIVIQEKTADTSDPYGGVSYTWADVATVWAQLLEERTQEFLRGEIGTTRESARAFRIRWRPGVNVGQRVMYGGEPHDIESVAEIGRRRGLELRCRRRVGDQGA